jgi:hypothetical protein
MNAMALAPSIRTRQLFREFLVGTVLRYIDDVFTGAGIRMGTVPPEQLPGGQRRSLVEEYYAGVDWSSPRDVNKVLRAYEHILFDAVDGDEKQRLIKALRLDGFTVDESGRISPPASLDLGIDRNTLDDPDALAGYERRILENVEADPSSRSARAKNSSRPRASSSSRTPASSPTQAGPPSNSSSTR